MSKKFLKTSNFLLLLLFISCKSNTTKVRELTKDNSNRINHYSQIINDTAFFADIKKEELEDLLGLNIHLNNITNFNHTKKSDWCEKILELNDCKQPFLLTLFFEKNLIENEQSIISIVDSNYGDCDLWTKISDAYYKYGFMEISKKVQILQKNKSNPSLLNEIKAIKKSIKAKANELTNARIDNFYKNKQQFLTRN